MIYKKKPKYNQKIIEKCRVFKPNGKQITVNIKKIENPFLTGQTKYIISNSSPENFVYSCCKIMMDANFEK
jgi:hypothetical protein